MNNDPFENFSNFISLILMIVIVVLFLGIIFSCSNKDMYHIYLKHQPDEVLYETDSLKDAEDYYNQYKPFHSDMYITKN
jgi:hypothetical protein